MRSWLSLTLLIALLYALPVIDAQAMSGLELLDYCTSSAPAGRTHCKGYIGGVLEAALVISLQNNSETLPFCTPLEGIKPKQFVMVVVKYLEDNPGKLHDESVFLVLEALEHSFPCSMQQK